ncbi:MAG: PEP-CTERM sorting domain-containing protein [Spartobacteria bacterium]|nr:PEP-CTERM sorting domain-containing protein [Spartobacteria bacterium]
MTKKTTRKKQHIERKWALYLAVAAASLITAGGAAAAVIYQQNLNQDFGVGAGDYNLTMEGTSADLRFFGASSSSFGDAATYSFSAQALGNAAVMVAGSDVDMLNTSEFVNDSMGTGASGTFYYYENNGMGSITTHGDWTANGTRGYLGFSFEREEDGRTVYGWADIERVSQSSGTLHSWAYEDSGGAIQVGSFSDGGSAVPEPGTLAMLALGTVGTLALRRRRQKNSVTDQ